MKVIVQKEDGRTEEFVADSVTWIGENGLTIDCYTKRNGYLTHGERHFLPFDGNVLIRIEEEPK